MSSILVATARESVRAEVLLPLAREGLPVASAADWEGLCGGVCAHGTTLVLVDPELPRLRPALLSQLVGTLSPRPTLRALGATLEGIPRVHATDRAILRLARQVTGGARVDPSERRVLQWQGLGGAPLERLSGLAASGLPTLIHGERGTGKERVARVLHRISGAPGPFVALQAHAPWSSPSSAPALPSGPASEGTAEPSRAPPGTLYLESVHRRDDLRAVVGAAREAGWRVIGSTRLPEPVPGIKWDRVVLPPLRERPDDLRGLTGWYLHLHTRRMGLPKRRLDRGLWALLNAHRWPGNHRELEMFVVLALGRVDAPILRAATLPADLQSLLSPHAEAEREAESFEEMARTRLAPVVRAFTQGPGDTLHALVVGSTERALIQLVLARTQGNRKAAAALLGMARNTLHARIIGLGLDASGKD